MADKGGKRTLRLNAFPRTYMAMRTALAAILLLIGVASCESGERPFRMVQFCLGGTEQIDELKTVARSIAAANSLDFYDRSAEAEAEAFSIAKSRTDAPVTHPMLMISARAPDGRTGFSATNFSDAPSQVVIGFSKGDDETAARKLSDDVVQALGRRWSTREVPNVAERGASPLKDCDKRSASNVR
jgi:hypothetical protein